MQKVIDYQSQLFRILGNYLMLLGNLRKNSLCMNEGPWSLEQKKPGATPGNHWKSVPPPKKNLHGKFEIATFRIDFLGEVCAYRGKGGERYFLQMSYPKKFNESSLTTLSSNLLSCHFGVWNPQSIKPPRPKTGGFSAVAAQSDMASFYL